MILGDSFKFSSSAFFPEYMNNELLRDGLDTLRYTFKDEIDFVNDQFFSLHLMILYENELGQLYDTYFWFPSKFKPLDFPSPFIVKDQKIFMREGIVKINIAKKYLVSFMKPKISYEQYSEKQTLLIKGRFEDAMKKTAK